MKKILIVMIAIMSFKVQAQFVDFKDSSSKNKFLGLDLSMCKTQTDTTSKNYQKGYDCGNSSVSEYLNLNFLSPQVLGQQFYLYNNFMYWVGNNNQSSKQATLAMQQPDQYFSGAGVFMIVIGTSPYLQKMVAPQKTCPAGKTLLVAQLKYNDGNSIVCWSQDSICLAPTDKFAIQISSDQDNTVPAKSSESSDAQGINWMHDPGPAANYEQAKGSPRKIRLILQ